MEPIPQDRLHASLAVLHWACLHARMLGYEGEARGLPADRCRLLADLMDAVHNIPELLTRWPSCNEPLLLGMLEDFDAKWPDAGFGLAATYRKQLEGQ